MAKEYVAPYNDLVVEKTYRVELWASWPPARIGVIKQSLSKVIKISDEVISFETQNYNKELSELSTTYDVPRDGHTSRSGHYYKIFETAKDMTDRKLRKQALEQALQTGRWNTSSITGVDGRVIKFNEPVTNTAKVMAEDWFGGGRKYKTRKTKMHKKKKMRTKKNTNKKMKKKQTRTRRKR